MNVGQLAQQILSLDPQKNPARLAFYHYLKNMLSLEAAFTPEMIDAFYDRTLCFQHWQSNKQQLGTMVRDDLMAIHSRHPLGFDLEQVIHAHELQLITLEHARDFAALLARDVAKMEKNGEKVKSFRLRQVTAGLPQDVLFVRLQNTGRVVAEVRQNIAFVIDGELQLIRPHSRLTYTSDLEFDTEADQIIATSLLRVARFTVGGRNGDVMRGSFMQGASFHRSESFDRPLSDIPELFQAVKNIEKYFINPVTDPYYNQLIENFEQVRNEKQNI